MQYHQQRDAAPDTGEIDAARWMHGHARCTE
jgi:hypothetical protein